MKSHKYSLIVIIVVVFSSFLFFCYGSEVGKATVSHTINSNKDSIVIEFPFINDEQLYLIDEVIDLEGRTIHLNLNSKYRIGERGLIKNGTLVGHNTELEYNGVVFENVHITGTWLVKSISTSMFKSLDYDNSLKDVFALTSPKIHNEVYISSGRYTLVAKKESDVCITLGSNTNVILDGDIILSPNNYISYSILLIEGNNIIVQGKGSIIGDKKTHLGSKGEWGMGVYISKGMNYKIKGIRISDCWGDCIYINNSPNDIMIEDCILNNGRRQGISIISGDSIVIKDCTITNVSGTPPEYAIDIEPNAKDTVGTVLIQNIYVKNCKGGFSCSGTKKDAYIGNIIIRDCKVRGTELRPLEFRTGRKVKIENCEISRFSGYRAIQCNNIDTVIMNNNTIKESITKKIGRRLLGKGIMPESVKSYDYKYQDIK